MTNRTISVLGVPTTCNNVKMKLFFQAKIKRDLTCVIDKDGITEVTFSNEKDAESFVKLFPLQFEFGGKNLELTVKKEPQEIQDGHEQDVHKEVLLLDKVHSWYDLDTMPPYKRGLLVQSLNQKEDLFPKDVKIYFEDESSSLGGKIASIIQMIDGLLIFYEDEAIVEKVWQHRPHRVQDQPVLVFIKLVPPPRKGGIYLETPENQSEENVKSDLELMDSSTSPISPKIVSKIAQGKFLVKYSRSTDEASIENVLQEFRKSVDGNFQIKKLLQIDCLKVTDIPNNTTQSEIITLFENKFRSGGGQVTFVEKVDEKTMLLYFASYEDALNVSMNSSKHSICLFGHTLKICQYHHCLYSDTVTEEPNREIQTEKPTEQILEKNFYYSDISSDVLAFFKSKPKHLNALEKKIGGKVQVSNGKLTVGMMPGNQQLTLDAYRREMKELCSCYVSEKFNDFKSTDIDKIRGSFSDYRFSTDFTGNEDLSARWTGENRYILVCTGHKDYVESFCASLKKSIHQRNCQMILQPEKLEWIRRFKILESLPSRDIVYINEPTGELIFTGNSSDNKTAQREITDKIQDIQCVMYCPKSIELQSYILRSESKTRIMQQIQTTKMKDSKIMVKMAGKQIKLCGPKKVVDDVISFLDENLIDKNCPVTFSVLTRNVSTKDEIREMRENGWITVNTYDQSVIISGFKEGVNKALKNLEALCMDAEELEIISMPAIKAKFLVEKCSDLHGHCKESGVKFSSTNSGIKLQGNKSGLLKISHEAKVLASSLFVNLYSYSKLGINQFFKIGYGQALLDKLQHELQSIIIPNNPADIVKSPGRFDQVEHGMAAGLAGPDTSTRIGSIEILLKKGDLTLTKADDIVNCTMSFTDLKSGGSLSRHILEKGGSHLQKEVDDNLSADLRISSRGNLQGCNRIIHILSPLQKNDIEKCIHSILTESGRKKSKSLAIPMIGESVSSLKKSEVAYEMIESIQVYTENHPSMKYPKTISIVIQDNYLLETFKTELLMHKGVPKSTSGSFSNTSSNQSPLTSESPLKIYIKQGDITKSTNDVIVNSIGRDFDLSQGQVSRTILKNGGSIIQDEILKYFGHDVVVTSAGRLACHSIIHVVTPTDKGKLLSCLIDVFKVAEKYQFKSMSLPLLGAGNIRMNPTEVGEIFAEAVENFCLEQRASSPFQILDIVIFDKMQINAFTKGLNSKLSGQVQIQEASSSSSAKAAINSFIGRFKSLSQGHEKTSRPDAKFYRDGHVDESDVDADSINFCICSRSPRDSDITWRELQRELQECLSQKEHDDPLFSQLSPEQVIELVKIGENAGITLIRPNGSTRIVTAGHKDLVVSASQDIDDFLRRVKQSHSKYPR